METIYVTIILTTSAGIVGFLLRMLMDNINGILNNRKVKRIEYIEFLISEFYMPIYILLHRENIIWNKIVTSEIRDSKIIKELDNENLNNHLEIQKIIMSNMAKASPRNDIAEQLIKYDEHVTIFKTLRKIGSNDFPIKYNSEYPTQLCYLIEKRMEELKQDKKLLLGLFGNTPFFYIKTRGAINKLLKTTSYFKKNKNSVTNKLQINHNKELESNRRPSSMSDPFSLTRNNSSNINTNYINDAINDNNNDIELSRSRISISISSRSNSPH
jgi:hypothetical protein